MSKPTAKVKDRWNKANYDTIMVRVTKGHKELVAAQAESNGMSLNGYINKLIENDKKPRH
jgi:predicted HicB family RNase H-like nuclease